MWERICFQYVISILHLNFPFRQKLVKNMSEEEGEAETPSGPVENAWSIKVPEFKKGDMKSHLLEESSFSVLFPKYREKYLRECWPLLQKTLDVRLLTPFEIITFNLFNIWHDRLFALCSNVVNVEYYGSIILKKKVVTNILNWDKCF